MSEAFTYSLRHRLKEPKTIVFTALAVLIVALSIAFFTLGIKKPNIGAVLSRIDNEWIVSQVDFDGMAIRAGIKIGDMPVEINGQPAQTFLAQYEAQGTVFSYLITDITTIDSKGLIKTVAIKDGSQSWQAVSEAMASLTICLVFWIAGFYVFYKRPKNLAALLFCLCSAVFGLAMASNMAGERSIPTANIFAVVATTFGPWVLLHFFLTLPEERTRIHSKPLVYLIYLPAIITLILFPLIGYANGQATPAFRNLRLIEIGIAFLACGIVAVFNYIYASSARTRQQLKIVAISCLLAIVPFVIFTLIPETVFNITVIPGGLGIFFVAIIPLGMGYAIVTQRIMDIDLVIRRGLIYGLITIIITAVISTIIFYVMNYQKSFGIVEDILTSLVLGAVAVALFGPAKSGIEYLVDKFFYKDRYDYRETIRNLSTGLNTLNDINDSSRLIVGTIVRALNLAGASLYIKVEGEIYVMRAAEGSFLEEEKQNQLLLLTGRLQEVSVFPDSAAKIDPDLAFIIPLTSGQKEVGVLYISQKTSRQDFSSTDIFLLQELAIVASSTLRNALVMREVNLRYTWVSIASHELRAPLSAIVGYSDLLLKANTQEGKQKQWLKNIRDNGLIISDMADDLLNVSRIQAGKVNMKIESVKVPEIVDLRVSFARETTTKHQFTINCEPDLPEATADRDKLGQIISNLLSNAIKYSPKGGNVTISARNDTQKQRLIISVEDQGIGISKEDQTTLFKTFNRIQRPETTTIRGSGLGLYIVKEWIQEMKGEVWMESELNKGSTFSISVPIYNGGKQTTVLPSNPNN